MQLTSLLIPILLIVVFYFLLIRPQQKRAKQHREMVNQLQSGQNVTTIGGIKGTVRSVDETVVVLTLNNGGTEITLEKQSVRQVDPS
ncbi:preprotein translocase subunit YajC [Staphylococcus auricularis]|uniref:Preprotein translocase subunit YajC n=1 Tax=Staphylococcus auricularis TaxID=29379 RepID=A0AAP8TSW0_9STAP|nr:preprotein translocase subunit YajC [Staphylococcus auricularis]MBM0868047.1 preprotein translocase subunit YajC [Staphylococcus auricularis]MCE5038242.1 preprotein translocase subunit YajC [Staphylococcus auricularis]MCG7340955.1 preprotein translocase subunit YajC [Staphylococcus auricularis]MDC6326865.1 preprotein translocase subunit YajC [Staphylococcus auricularis]MDN4532742.1 preprotein translocase subunit YajC [Staphylococcus auricularis]